MKRNSTEVLSMYNDLMRGRKFKVLCSDGRIRTARATSEPDTYFSIPAVISVWDSINKRSISISGYITGTEPTTIDGVGVEHEFRQYLYGKNGSVLPKWH